jgi:hypothetical protein
MTNAESSTSTPDEYRMFVILPNVFIILTNSYLSMLVKMMQNDEYFRQHDKFSVLIWGAETDEAMFVILTK